MGAPIISVLMPYRNAESTIRQAVDSLLLDPSNVDIPLEVLAINDHSTDAGPLVIQALAAQDSRLNDLSAPERGIANALQFGLLHARGAYIARMDADDISLPGRLSAELRLLEQNPRLGIVGTQVQLFSPASIGEGMLRYIAWQNALISPEDHQKAIFIESPLCHPSVMIRKSALEHAGGFRQGPFPEDYECWLRLNAHGYQIAKVPRVLFHWRQHSSNATFYDPRYALERFTETRALYLAPWLLSKNRPIALWGAGQTGKRLARALETHGVRASLFIDIDPKKIGSVARGAPICDASALKRGQSTVVVAVGARGARDLVREYLLERGFLEGEEFICAA